MGNLDLYERYAQPPQNALKDFNNGKFHGTDINPMWRIRALTEAFGPCGIGWYTEVVRQWREDTPDGAATVYCHINLYIKVDGEWSKPITGIGGNTLTRVTRNGSSTTDEAFKMAYTDAMGIACKALGFGANIWWKYDKTKYTESDGADNNTSESEDICEDCKQVVTDYIGSSCITKAADIAAKSKAKYGVCLCGRCSVRRSKITKNQYYNAEAVQEVVV